MKGIKDEDQQTSFNCLGRGVYRMNAEKITNKRQKAMDVLYQSKVIISSGNFEKGLEKCEEALSLDNELALAHLIRGHFAFNQGQDEKALKHLEYGLQQIDQEDQLINFRQDPPAIHVSKSELKGDHMTILGMVYVTLAEENKKKNNIIMEQMYLEKAYKVLTGALKEKPTPQLRDSANNLLKEFKK
jgi:tetratricopeptide (TPR) repeat protein